MMDPIAVADSPLARVPRPWVRWAAVIVALLGWYVSLVLLQAGLNAGQPNALLDALCGGAKDGVATFDCHSVIGSKWGSVAISSTPGAMRIPISAYGMGYFAFVALWYLLIGPPTRARRPWHMVIAAVVAIGLLQSAQSTWIMHAVLKRYCVGCLTAHALNVVLAILTIAAFPWGAERTPYEPHPRGRLVIATFAGGAFLFMLHVVVAFVFVQNATFAPYIVEYRKIAEDPAFIRWRYEQQPTVVIPEPPGRPFYGNADAANTVVAFVDFECPVCKQVSTLLGELTTQHPDRLRVIFRHYPLDPECNPDVPTVKHPAACDAARASEAALILGGEPAWREMRKLMYARQEELEERPFVAWGQEIGLDGDAFAKAMNSEAAGAQIADDVALAHELGITTNPVLYLNGRRLHHWSKSETWKALLGLDEAAADGAP